MKSIVFSSNDVIYGSVVKATCSDGWTFTKNNNTVYVTCLEESVWNAKLQACQSEANFHTKINVHLKTFLSGWNLSGVECPESTEVRNAITIGNDYMFADNRTIKCETGMRHVDGHVTKTITCLQSGDWSEMNMSCAGKQPVPNIWF